MRRIIIMFTCSFLLISAFSATPAQAAVAASTFYDGSYPTVITEDAAGNVYIAEDHDADPTKLGIVVIPAITGTLYGQSVIAGTAHRLVSVANPTGVAISPTGTLMWSLPNGNIYALASTSRTVFAVSVAANTVTQIETGTALTNGIDFDSSGNLFGIGQTPGSISVIPVASGIMYGYSLTANVPETLLAPDNLHWFWDLAIDSSGNIFVTDGWGDADIGQGVFVFPRTSGTLYGESVSAGFLSRMTTFGSARYSGIDIDDSDVIFTNPYGGPTKVLSAADTSLFNTSITSNIAVSIEASSGYASTGILATRSGALVVGGFSTTYKLTSAPDISAPGIPEIGTATARSPTSASITFTAPTSDGGATIETYTATSTPGSVTGTVRRSESGSVTVTGLTPSTAYTFTVTASNSVGTSSASSSSVSITTPASQAEIDAAALAAKKAAEAKREAEKQAAQTEIWDCLTESRLITINNFTSAEIYGVTKKNYDHVIQDINYKLFDESNTALIESQNLTIFVVEQVVKKYVILDSICYPGTFSQFTANDLASVDLIPYENRSVITYKLRHLPLFQRDDYAKIENAISDEILLLETREERLDEVLSWNLPEDYLLPEPAKNGIFPCGSGGTYTVVSGHVTGSDKCAGKLTFVSSVTAIDAYAFAQSRYIRGKTSTWIRQEPQITELVVPNTVKSIGASAFSDNEFLISISISDSVKTIGREAFRQSNNVTSLTIGSGAALIESDTYQEFRYLTKLVVPEGVTRIDSGAFTELYSVTSLTLPSTLTTLGEASLRGMHSLRTMNIPANLSTTYDPFHYLWYAPLSVPYLCSTTGASNTASVNAYFATLIAYNTTAGRCTNSFDAPVITSVTYPNSTSATVNFTTPSNFGAGTAISSYSLNVLPGGKRVTISGDSDRSITIDSLIPGQKYSFEVTAMNNENPIISSSPSVRRLAKTK